ncbi:MAG: RHS repeat-associated core domain-containing protein, partial [Arenibacter sp.]
QTGSSGQWVLLGTFALNKGSELNITGGEGTVVDAFRLEERVDLRPQFSDPELYYSHNDHLGSPVAMTDAQGQIVWDVDRKPFGEVSYRINRATNNLRFPGQYFDEETGLHYNYFRDYDPTAGRYIQSDPIGQNGGVNTYAYVENNPFKNIDPLGLRGIGVRIIQIYPMSRSNRQIDQVLQEGLHNPEQACLLGQCFPIVPQQCKFTTCDLSRNLENSDVCPAETNSAEFRATNDRGCKCLKY